MFWDIDLHSDPGNLEFSINLNRVIVCHMCFTQSSCSRLWTTRMKSTNKWWLEHSFIVVLDENELCDVIWINNEFTIRRIEHRKTQDRSADKNFAYESNIHIHAIRNIYFVELLLFIIIKSIWMKANDLHFLETQSQYRPL